VDRNLIIMGIGSSIASSMKNMQEEMMEKQKKFQGEMQERMMGNQKENQRIMQEKMRRQMLSFQMAMARERFYWLAGVGAFFLTGIAAAAARGKAHAALIAPVTAYSVLMAYQWDFAWGGKANRIFEFQKQILTEEGEKNYWFTPLVPTPEQLKALDELETFRPLKNGGGHHQVKRDEKK